MIVELLRRRDLTKEADGDTPRISDFVNGCLINMIVELFRRRDLTKTQVEIFRRCRVLFTSYKHGGETATERILTVNKRELENRTKRFALRIIAFVASLPKGRIGDVVGYQLLKAGTSIGANYREANRAESRNDFIHKVAIVEKESSESHYWLELVHESNLGEIDERKWLLTEAGELLAIFTQIGKSTKSNRRH